jgi:hypothetical protein
MKTYLLRECDLAWPSDFQIPSKRFRLFVAADVVGTKTEAISEFAQNALKAGMLYFCAWGPGCEKFHDIVDEQIVANELDEGSSAGPGGADTVMTTWHQGESLEEAFDFFVNLAQPSSGFEQDSETWVAICVNSSEWTQTVRRLLDELAADPHDCITMSAPSTE